MATNVATPVSPLTPGALHAGDHRGDAEFSWTDPFQKWSYFGLLGLVGLLTYSYWNMLEETSKFWEQANYSHGYLVPMIAVYIAWSMRPNPAAQQPPEDHNEATFLDAMPASLFAKVGAGAGAAAIALGYQLQSPLLQGAGLAIACLVCFAYVLIGQAFQPVSGGERWAGLAILVAGYGLRMFAATVYSQPLDRYSFLVALLGGFVMVGGWSLVRWAGASLGFLFFMYPIPSAIEQPLLLNLQRLAAVCSEVVLTILGIAVSRRGNTLQVEGIPDELGVAEACSGLRMLTIFLGFAVACALLIRRPWWDRLIVLLSAIPIALIANITRIVITALLYRLFPESDSIRQLIHDYAGLAMMPIGMGLLYLELKLLAMLSTEEEDITGYGGDTLGQFGANPTG